MPPAPKLVTSSPSKAPYKTKGSSGLDDALTSSSSLGTASPGKKRNSNPGKPWTSEELVLIFKVATKRGASSASFEGVIEGRTGKQCYDNWNNTIAPYIQKMLVERGNRGKRGE